MVKHVNIVFEDAEFAKLTKTRGKQSWHDFVLKLLARGKHGKQNKS